MGAVLERNNLFIPAFFTLGFVCVFSSVSIAEDSVLSPVVVTAGRLAEDISSVSLDVTIISHQQIERSQAASAADVLRGYAGINVAANGGAGKTTSVYLRGANPGQTLVLLDGVRVGSSTTGSFDWAHLSAMDIERIEIVRGPQSTLYGADAMGGVIQIFTRRGIGEFQASADAEFGGHGHKVGAVHASGSENSGVRYAINGEIRRTNGISAATNGSERDSYRHYTVSGKFDVPVGLGELQLLGRLAQGKNDLDGGTPPRDILTFTNTTRQNVLSLKASYPLSDMGESSLQLSRFEEKFVSRDPASTTNNADIKTRTQELTWQNDLRWSAFSALLGLNLRQDRGQNPDKNIDRKISQKAGFATLGAHAEYVDLSAGIRFDKNDTFNNQTTYRFGVVVRPWQGLKLTSNYGTGFKTPSINDLYWPATAWSSGNVNLRPEKSRGWDAGLWLDPHWGDLKAELGVVWFWQDFKNLIAWAQTSPGFWQPSNVGSARTKGLELSGGLAWEPVYLRANWTFLSAKNLDNDTWLNRRAKDSGSVTLGAEIMGFSAEAQTDIAGPRFSGTGNTSRMHGYHKTDLRLAYAVSRHWKLRARVENVEGKIYEEVSGYGVLGRTFYGGVSAVF